MNSPGERSSALRLFAGRQPMKSQHAVPEMLNLFSRRGILPVMPVERRDAIMARDSWCFAG